MKSITKFVLLFSILSSSAAFSTLQATNLSNFKSGTTTSFLTNNEGSYDMGIGKNQPLHVDLIINPVVSTTDDDDRRDDIYGIAKFMGQYESTRKFPSPLDSPQLQLHSTRDEPVSDKEQHEPQKIKRKLLPKIKPKRQLEDVLFILTDDLGESSLRSETLPTTYHKNGHPVMIQPAGNRQLDINSIWVEMLIHNQQIAATGAL